MIDWGAVLTTPMDAVERGFEDHTDTFGDPIIGPRFTFKRLDYPCAMIVPQQHAYDGQNNYTQTVSVLHLFRFDRGDDYRDIVREVADTFGDVLDALGAEECIGNHKPTNIEFLAGEPDGNLLVNIRVDYQVSVLVDLAQI